MRKISFSHNWNNKLDEKQKIFSSVRKATPDKYQYYESSLKEEFLVVLGGKSKGKAFLEYVCQMQFNQIPFPLLMLDTGMSDWLDIVTLFQNFGVALHDDVIVLVFRR